jgi:hypothetical protein
LRAAEAWIRKILIEWNYGKSVYECIMKRGIRVITLIATAAWMGMSVGCMTTYDSAGRPVQSVDPGLAVAGVAAAGLLGYALADGHGHGHYAYGPPPPVYCGPAPYCY